MAKLFNLARMTTATAGTGTITLGTAVSGYLTFALAGVQNGDTVSYGIKDGSNSEVGTGVYTASGTTLTRSVTKSTNSDAAISLSGAAEVFITARKEDILNAADSLTSAQTAAKSDQTTATSTTLAVTPARQQNHPSAIKAWAKFSDNGTSVSVLASFNVSSITRNGTGDYTVNFTTAFANTNYVGVAMGSNDGVADASIVRRPNTAQTTTAMRFLFTNTGGSASNANPGFVMFVGDQ